MNDFMQSSLLSISEVSVMFCFAQVIAAGGPDAQEHTNMRLGGYAGFGIASSRSSFLV